MSESQMLTQKIAELEMVLAEVQGELARAAGSRRSEAHDRLAATVKEARAWLETSGGQEAEGDAAAAQARKAEGFLHQMQMQRTEL